MSDKKDKPLYSTDQTPDAHRQRFLNKICKKCNSSDLKATAVPLKEPVVQQKAVAETATRFACRTCGHSWTGPNFQV